MGIKERQERERESVRRAILDAARDLFTSEGYGNVSLRKIADRIEYSPAAIYSYFPSKDDIFFALAEEGFELLHGMITAVPVSDDPVETLRRHLWMFYEFSKRHPEHFALMFVDRSVPRIRTSYESFPLLNNLKRDTAMLIQRCVDCGAFPGPVDPLSAFRVLSAALSGPAIAALCNRLAPQEDADRLAEDVLNLMLFAYRSGVPTSFVASQAGCFGDEKPAGSTANEKA